MQIALRVETIVIRWSNRIVPQNHLDKSTRGALYGIKPGRHRMVPVMAWPSEVPRMYKKDIISSINSFIQQGV